MGGKTSKQGTEPNLNKWRTFSALLPIGYKVPQLSFPVWFSQYPHPERIKERAVWLHLVAAVAYSPSHATPAAIPINKRYLELSSRFYREGVQKLVLELRITLIPFSRFWQYDQVATQDGMARWKLWQVLSEDFWRKNKVFSKTTGHLHVAMNMERALLSIWECACLLEGQTRIDRVVFRDSLSHLSALVKSLLTDPVKNPPVHCAGDALNRVRDTGKPASAIEQFLFDLWDSFGSELVKRRGLIICQHCGRYAAYFRDKKYCSKSVDGRDCQKAATNVRDYRRHKPRRLRAKRNWIRKTRQEMPGY